MNQPSGELNHRSERSRAGQVATQLHEQLQHQLLRNAKRCCVCFRPQFLYAISAHNRHALRVSLHQAEGSSTFHVVNAELPIAIHQRQQHEPAAAFIQLLMVSAAPYLSLRQRNAHFSTAASSSNQTPTRNSHEQPTLSAAYSCSLVLSALLRQRSARRPTLDPCCTLTSMRLGIGLPGLLG